MKTNRINTTKEWLNSASKCAKRDFEVVCDRCFEFGLDDQSIGDSCWSTTKAGMPCGGTLYEGPTKKKPKPADMRQPPLHHKK